MKNFKLQPLNDKVIIKPTDSESVTKSGLVLPQTSKEKPEQGEVVAMGPGKLLDNGQRASMTVKIGDKVMFKKYSPDEIKVGQETYLIVSEDDIIAICK